MRRLYRFYVDYGRMGEIEGLFVEDEQTVSNVMGRTVRFYEVLGKHSEVSVTLDDKCLYPIHTPEGFVQKFEELHLSSGINPIYYAEEQAE